MRTANGTISGESASPPPAGSVNGVDCVITKQLPARTSAGRMVVLAT